MNFLAQPDLFWMSLFCTVECLSVCWFFCNSSSSSRRSQIWRRSCSCVLVCNHVSDRWNVRGWESIPEVTLCSPWWMWMWVLPTLTACGLSAAAACLAKLIQNLLTPPQQYEFWKNFENSCLWLNCHTSNVLLDFQLLSIWCDIVWLRYNVCDPRKEIIWESTVHCMIPKLCNIVRLGVYELSTSDKKNNASFAQLTNFAFLFWKYLIIFEWLKNTAED